MSGVGSWDDGSGCGLVAAIVVVVVVVMVMVIVYLDYNNYNKMYGGGRGNPDYSTLRLLQKE